MGYKTVSLSDEAYEKLASLKAERESFSDVVLRLSAKKPRKPLTSFAGAWDMTDEEEGRVFSEISRMWEVYEEGLFRHRFPRSTAKKES